MLNDAPNLNYLWAALIVEELVRSGVRTFCLSPGSRNTPLTLAAAAHEGVETFVHYDERGTVFYALGRARASREPSVFICTSGTALANALPGVVEASMAQAPLILLTADRPPELLDAGANQTIDQTNIFGGYVRWSHTFPCPSLEVPPEAVLTAVDQAVYRAIRPPAGPVHLNCMLREPLAPTRQDFDRGGYMAKLGGWLDGTGPYTRYPPSRHRAGASLDDETCAVLRDTARGILVVGQLESRREQEAVQALAHILDWPVLPDATSGLRFCDMGGRSVHYYDQMLLSDATGLCETEVVLHIGGSLTSKRPLAFLSAQPLKAYLRVADHPMRWDPVHRITHRVESDIESFVQTVEAALGGPGKTSADSAWAESLTRASTRVDAYLEGFTAPEQKPSEISVARLVSQHAPADSVLFLGNSMPIRDADMFGARRGHRLRVAANRGASGIDGTIATALGHAAAAGTAATAVVGDLAALHDLNSLPLLLTAPAPLVLIVINNDGGGIFSMLPIAEHPGPFERFFGVPHGLGFEAVAGAFGIPYAKPDTNTRFVEMYKAALDSGKSALIEVITSREENAELHRRVYAHVAQTQGAD